MGGEEQVGEDGGGGARLAHEAVHEGIITVDTGGGGRLLLLLLRVWIGKHGVR